MMGDESNSGSDDISDTELFEDTEEKEEMESGEGQFLFNNAAQSENIGLADFQNFDAETQDRLQALLHAAGITKIPGADCGRAFADPDIFRRLTTGVGGSCPLDDATMAALARMKMDDAANPSSDSLLSSFAIAQHLSQRNQVLPSNAKDGQASNTNNVNPNAIDTVKTASDSATEDGESLLSLACSAGYFELAQVLLAMRTNVEDRGTKGDCTPLMEASSAGHVEIVQLLISHGADVNAQSTNGQTPLMFACTGGHEPVVKCLLEAGAKVDSQNESGHTALMEAASSGHVEIAKILVEAGAVINAHSHEFKQESSLTLACYKGHLEMVKYLMETLTTAEDMTPECLAEELHTALMEASMDGHVDVARLLLDNGAQVNMPADSFESPLTLAACGGHVELAALLLERGANIEEVNDEGYTPLMESVREGHTEMAMLLLGAGADVNAQTDETGETALTLACCGGFFDLVVVLVTARADLELGSSTALMEAAQDGHTKLVEYLIQKGAKLNRTTPAGDTALSLAAEAGHLDAVALLVEAGADVELACGDGGKTPLMKAARQGHQPVVEYLVSKGAKINRTTSANDHTALSLACAGGHLPVVELLLKAGADPNYKLKDSSTMLIEAAKGGHTAIVQLLLDWPGTLLPGMTNADGETIGLPIPQSLLQSFSQIPVKDTLKLTQYLLANSAALSGTVSLDATTGSVDLAVDPAALFGPNATSASAVFARECAIRLMQKNIESGGQTDIVSFCRSPEEKMEMARFLQANWAAHWGPNPFNKLSMENQTKSEAIDPTSQESPFLDSFPEPIVPTSQETSAAGEVQRQQGGGGGSSILPGPDPEPDSGFHSSAISINNGTPPTEMGGSPPTATQGSVATEEKKTISEEQLQALKAYALGELKTRSLNARMVPTGRTIQLDEKQMEQVRAYLAQVNTQSQQQQTAGTTVLSTSSNVSSNDPDTLKGPILAEGTLTAEMVSADGVTTKIDITDPKQLEELRAHFQKAAVAACSLIEASAASNIAGLHTTGQPDPEISENEKEAVLNKAKSIFFESPLVQGKLQTMASNALGLSGFASPRPRGLSEGSVSSIGSVGSTKSGAKCVTEAALASKEAELQAAMKELDRLKRTQEIYDNLQKAGQELVDKGEGTPKDSAWIFEAQQQLKVQQQKMERQAAAHQKQVHAAQQKHHRHHHATLLKTQQSGNPNVSAIDLLPKISANSSATSAPSLLTTPSPTTMFQFTPTRPIHTPPTTVVDQVHWEQLFASKNLYFDELGRPYGSGNSQATSVTSAPASTASFQFANPPPPPATTTSVLSSNTLLPNVSILAQSTATTTTTTPTMSRREMKLRACSFRDPETSAFLPFSANTVASGGAVPDLPEPPKTAADGVAPTACDVSFGSIGKKYLENVSAGKLGGGMTVSMEDIMVKVRKSSTGGVLVTSAPPAKVATGQPGKDDEKAIRWVSQKDIVAYLPPKNFEGMVDGILPFMAQYTITQPITAAMSQQILEDIAAHASMIGMSPLAAFPMLAAGDPFTLPQLSSAEAQSALSTLSSAAAQFNNLAFSVAATGLQKPSTAAPPTQPKAAVPIPPPPPPGAGNSTKTPTVAIPSVDLNTQTESNHDTALTVACAGGHCDMVKLLMDRGADVEHRDKKGFTPLILAATAGHVAVAELMLQHGADIEAQSDRTKDTALSLACSGGKKEVVEMLLKHSANKEHRNVSDYTPLSLAASGGYVDIILLLLNYGADINSRGNGSKLGISPLMLASMNGHVPAVKVLLERGADINAQIETNRNTALTLACFQGRHEVVRELLRYKANVEHRAKTGLTPLMEAASGGYVEVGKILIENDAEINAIPVPSSKDTALIIASDKGHLKFVELLLDFDAYVDARNKRGCTPLWVAANSGHLEVAVLLVKADADVDMADNRKITPLMAAFRKGHVKVVRWLVKHVSQLPSDQDCLRYLATLTDKDLIPKCQECMKIMMATRDRQAAEANKNATNLLAEIEQEQQLAEVRKAAKARQKEKKKKKKAAAAKKENDDTDLPNVSKGNDQAPLLLALDSDSEEDEDKIPPAALTKDDSGIGMATAKSPLLLDSSSKSLAKPGPMPPGPPLSPNLAADESSGEQFLVVTNKKKLAKEIPPPPPLPSKKEQGGKRRGGKQAKSATQENQLGKEKSPPEAISANQNQASKKGGASAASANQNQASKKKSANQKAPPPVQVAEPLSSVNSSQSSSPERRVPAMPAGHEVPAPNSNNNIFEASSNVSQINNNKSNNNNSIPAGGLCWENSALRKSAAAAQQKGAKQTTANRIGANGSRDANQPISASKSSWAAATSTKTTSVTMQEPRMYAGALLTSTAPLQSSSALQKTPSPAKPNNGANNNAAGVHLDSGNDEWSSPASRKSGAGGRQRGGTNRKQDGGAGPPGGTGSGSAAASGAGLRRGSDKNAADELKRKQYKLYVPVQNIARVIGRGGNNINAIRETTGAHIEVDKQQRGETERVIVIRGPPEAAREAILMINGLICDQDRVIGVIIEDILNEDRRALKVYSEVGDGVALKAALAGIAETNKGVTPSKTSPLAAKQPAVPTKATPVVTSSAPQSGATGGTGGGGKGFPEITVWKQQPAPILIPGMSPSQREAAIAAATKQLFLDTAKQSKAAAKKQSPQGGSNKEASSTSFVGKKEKVAANSTATSANVSSVGGGKTLSTVTTTTTTTTASSWSQKASFNPALVNFAAVAKGLPVASLMKSATSSQVNQLNQGSSSANVSQSKGVPATSSVASSTKQGSIVSTTTTQAAKSTLVSSSLASSSISASTGTQSANVSSSSISGRNVSAKQQVPTSVPTTITPSGWGDLPSTKTSASSTGPSAPVYSKASDKSPGTDYTFGTIDMTSLKHPDENSNFKPIATSSMPAATTTARPASASAQLVGTMAQSDTLQQSRENQYNTGNQSHFASGAQSNVSGATVTMTSSSRFTPTILNPIGMERKLRTPEIGANLFGSASAGGTPWKPVAEHHVSLDETEWRLKLLDESVGQLSMGIARAQLEGTAPSSYLPRQTGLERETSSNLLNQPKPYGDASSLFSQLGGGGSQRYDPQQAAEIQTGQMQYEPEPDAFDDGHLEGGFDSKLFQAALQAAALGADFSLRPELQMDEPSFDFALGNEQSFDLNASSTTASNLFGDYYGSAANNTSSNFNTTVDQLQSFLQNYGRQHGTLGLGGDQNKSSSSQTGLFSQAQQQQSSLFGGAGLQQQKLPQLGNTSSNFGETFGLSSSQMRSNLFASQQQQPNQPSGYADYSSQGFTSRFGPAVPPSSQFQPPPSQQQQQASSKFSGMPGAYGGGAGGGFGPSGFGGPSGSYNPLAAYMQHALLESPTEFNAANQYGGLNRGVSQQQRSQQQQQHQFAGFSSCPPAPPSFSGAGFGGGSGLDALGRNMPPPPFLPPNFYTPSDPWAPMPGEATGGLRSTTGAGGGYGGDGFGQFMPPPGVNANVSSANQFGGGGAGLGFGATPDGQSQKQMSYMLNGNVKNAPSVNPSGNNNYWNSWNNYTPM